MSGPLALRVSIGLLIAQNLFLLVAAGVLFTRPAPVPCDGESGVASRKDAAVEQALLPVPVYDEEALALADLLRHLDLQMDLETILRRRPELDRVVQARAAARACTEFECPALNVWIRVVRENGGRVPNLSRWLGSGRPLAESLALAEYVALLSVQAREAAMAAGRPDLEVDASLEEEARACTQLDCEALVRYTEKVGLTLAAVGRSLPPLPALAATGNSMLRKEPSSQGASERRRGRGPTRGKSAKAKP